MKQEERTRCYKEQTEKGEEKKREDVRLDETGEIRINVKEREEKRTEKR